MKEYQSPSHTRWDCKYHVVFIPKRRKRRVFGVLRRHLGEVHKESKISRRAPDGRPRAHMRKQSAEVRGIQWRRVRGAIAREAGTSSNRKRNRFGVPAAGRAGARRHPALCTTSAGQRKRAALTCPVVPAGSVVLLGVFHRRTAAVPSFDSRRRSNTCRRVATGTSRPTRVAAWWFPTVSSTRTR